MPPVVVNAAPALNSFDKTRLDKVWSRHIIILSISSSHSPHKAEKDMLGYDKQLHTKQIVMQHDINHFMKYISILALGNYEKSTKQMSHAGLLEEKLRE